MKRELLHSSDTEESAADEVPLMMPPSFVERERASSEAALQCLRERLQAAREAERAAQAAADAALAQSAQLRAELEAAKAQILEDRAMHAAALRGMLLLAPVAAQNADKEQHDAAGPGRCDGTGELREAAEAACVARNACQRALGRGVFEVDQMFVDVSAVASLLQQSPPGSSELLWKLRPTLLNSKQVLGRFAEFLVNARAPVVPTDLTEKLFTCHMQFVVHVSAFFADARS
eukprot:m51a1_g13817 hypothetical protein (233) ;mRNA; f:420830-421965